MHSTVEKRCAASLPKRKTKNKYTGRVGKKASLHCKTCNMMPTARTKTTINKTRPGDENVPVVKVGSSDSATPTVSSQDYSTHDSREEQSEENKTNDVKDETGSSGSSIHQTKQATSSAASPDRPNIYSYGQENNSSESNDVKDETSSSESSRHQTKQATPSAASQERPTFTLTGKKIRVAKEMMSKTRQASLDPPDIKPN